MHGLLLDIETGRLDWVVNGYETWQKAPPAEGGVTAAGPIGGAPGSLGAFNIGEMKFPEGKIGELAAKTGDWLSHQAEKIGDQPRPARRKQGPTRPNKWWSTQKSTGRSRQKFPLRRPSARTRIFPPNDDD